MFCVRCCRKCTSCYMKILKKTCWQTDKLSFFDNYWSAYNWNQSLTSSQISPPLITKTTPAPPTYLLLNLSTWLLLCTPIVQWRLFLTLAANLPEQPSHGLTKKMKAKTCKMHLQSQALFHLSPRIPRKSQVPPPCLQHSHHLLNPTSPPPTPLLQHNSTPSHLSTLMHHILHMMLQSGHQS